MGYVCSICLSIFCEVPEGALCLTCGTKLRLGDYGRRPVVVPTAAAAGGLGAKKKKRKRPDGTGDGDGSGVGTPVGRGTPGL